MTDAIGRAFAEAALSYVGVPFKHLGRDRRRGLDCIGLLVVAAQDVALLPENFETGPYTPQANPKALMRGMIECGLRRTPTGNLRKLDPGRILLFRYRNRPQHLALSTGGDKFVHAYQSRKTVTTDSFTTAWYRRLIAVYDLA